MSMAGASFVGALPNPLFMIVHTMFVEAGAISLGVEMRPVGGSVNTEVMTDTFRIVMVEASETTTAGQTSQYLVQLLKFEVRYPLL